MKHMSPFRIIICIFAADYLIIMRKVLLWIMAVILASGCDSFQYHPYEVRFDGERNINHNNIVKIEEQCRNLDALYVAFISDSHHDYTDLCDMVGDINRRDSIDFVIHLGDLTDTGTIKEYVWARDYLARLVKPYVALIGNHDFLGTGDEIYSKMFGNMDFSFIAAGVKFLCVNTNATEYDHIADIPNFQFLEDEAIADSALFDRTVVCMHARPYSDQFNNNVAKPFEYYVKNLPGILFCINGHDHNLQFDDLFGDGLMYYGVTCASDRQYMIFNINKEGYRYEVIDY